MQDRRSNIISLFPLLLAAVLAAGFYLGYSYNPWDASDKDKEEVIKINTILSYIENNYVDDVDREDIVDKSIQSLLEHLDPHSSYIPPERLKEVNQSLEGRFVGVGVRFLISQDTLMVSHIIPRGPSERAGLKPGDRIIAVDGEDITTGELTNSGVRDLLLGQSGTTVELKIFRIGKGILTFDVQRGSVFVKSVDAAIMLTEDIGYVRVSQFGEHTFKEFYTATNKLRAQGMRKLIFDLRDNGGGYLSQAEEIADELLPKGKLIVYTEGAHRERKERRSKRRGTLEDMELAVLINSRSASASEIVAGAVQDNDRGIILGRRSFGKGLVQHQKEWSDGSAIRLTIARYYTPTGRSIQKPYGEGIDYDADQMERYENGELYEVDSSLFVDSLKYTTPQGRVVYGGGGIMPDIFVPYDTAYSSMYVTELIYADAFNHFSFRYMDKHRPEVKAFGSPEAFNDGFEVSDALLDEFLTYAEQHLNVARSQYGIQHSKEYIRNRLKADIARQVYGEDGYYYVRRALDNDITHALDLFEGRVENPLTKKATL